MAGHGRGLLAFQLLLRVSILSVLEFGGDTAHAASIRYDQSQFGDYNVQIQLKNIELYAILDEGILNSEVNRFYIFQLLIN